MNAAAILSWVLAGAPASPPEHVTSEFIDELAYVEVIDTGNDVQLLAYDAAGETIGVVALWSQDATMHVASDFADGYDEVVIVGEKVRNDSTLPPGVAAERAQAMLDVLAPTDPQAGKVGCGLGLVLAIAACSPPSTATGIGVGACAGSVYHAACECAGYVGPEPPEEWC